MPDIKNSKGIFKLQITLKSINIKIKAIKEIGHFTKVRIGIISLRFFKKNQRLDVCLSLIKLLTKPKDFL